MKKNLLLLFALLLSATMVSAQADFVTKINGESPLVKPSTTLKTLKKSPNLTQPKRITLADGERILGYYTGDSYDLNDAIGLRAAGDYKAGTMFSAEMIRKFVGGSITKIRFGLASSIGASTVRIYKYTSNQAAEISTTAVASTAAGWNEVTLEKPVTIEEGYGYLIGYDYTQVSGVYPLLVDYSVNTDREYKCGMLFYGNFGNSGTTWYNMGTSYGEFMIQAVVNDGSFVDDDIALKSLSTTELFHKANEQLGFSFKIKSDGNNIPNSYKLNVKLDGQATDATLNLPTSLTSSFQEATGTITLPQSMTSGKHELSVDVESINDVTPTDLIFDDTIKTDFSIYNESYPRQKHLVEHFTSQYCTYCPLGYAFLNALTSLRDDIAWVSIHGIGSYKDAYTVSNAAYITSFSISGYPAASFNRIMIDGEDNLATGIGYSSSQTNAAANMFSEILDEQSASIPSFATININSTYDPSTNKLDISVAGESVSDFSTLVGDDAVLTVYLTEDSLVSKQKNGNVYIQSFEHNNVLRAILSAPLGDAINWNGNTFENTYSKTLTEGWWTGNMNIVAFISRPIVYSSSKGFTTSTDDAWVVNTEKVHVGNASGIKGVVNDAKEAKVVARYTIDGRKIDAPVKGLNIVKLANGKTMKVIVK